MAKVYKWLSYQDSSARVNDLLETRSSGTGSWFLQSPDFQALLSGDIRVLWLHGSGMMFVHSYLRVILRSF